MSSTSLEDRLDRIEKLLSAREEEKETENPNREYNPAQKEFSPELREKYSKLLFSDNTKK